VISFVIPAYNEARYLAATLESIHAAARDVGEPYEIVVADDASTDATAQVAEQGGARVVRVQKRQIAGTRNAGARAGTGNRLIFVDADTRIDAAVLRAALAAMDAGAVGGGAAVRFAGAPWWAAALVAVLVPAFRITRIAAGCFVFARRDAFEAVGGFDEAIFAGEEIFLSRALGRRGRFVILRESVFTSPRKMDNRSFWAMSVVMTRLALKGGWKGVKRREDAGFWYEEKR
jgi:glycosyltransferase involved in cell wall biosynthesis